jgi:hypothetical protein
VRQCARERYFRQHPGNVDPLQRDSGAEKALHRARNETLIEFRVIGHQRRFSNVFKKEQEGIGRLYTLTLGRTANAVDEYVVVRTDDVLTQNYLERIQRVDHAIADPYCSNRDQMVIDHVETTGFNIGNDVTSLEMAASSIR